MTARPIEYRKYNQIKFYYGIVQEVLDDDDYKGKYIIKFRIPDIIDNLNDDEWPLAHPIMKHTSQVFKGDNVLIMQLDVDLQDFVYFSNDISESTGIRYKNCIITLANPDFGDDADNTLTIDVVSLKDAEDDDHEAEEVDKVHSRILVNEKSIDLKTVGKDDDVDSGSKYSEVLIDRGDAKKVEITATNGDSTSTSTITIKDNSITIDTDTNATLTLDGNTKSFEIKDKNNNTIKGDSQGIDINALSKQDIKMDNNGIDLKDILTNEIKTQGSGITASSVLQSNAELGALISMNNAAGGLAGMISDIWTEMLTLATNLVTLASACAAIQYIGPGALTNGTAAAVGLASSSIGTISAKMAMSKAVAK